MVTDQAQILEQTTDAVRIVTIDHPRRRNALTREMVAGFLEALQRFELDDAARVLVVVGSGRLAFCAGADMAEMAVDQAAGKDLEPILPHLYDAVLKLRKPTLAALNGDAVGGGLELALACDIRVAGRSARLGLPEVISGMVPRFGALALARCGSPGAALEMAMSGELISADAALRAGIINRVVDDDALPESALGLARDLSQRPPITVMAIKDMILGAVEGPYRALASRLPDTTGQGAEERRAGVAGFAERHRSRRDRDR